MHKNVGLVGIYITKLTISIGNEDLKIYEEILN